MDADLSHDPKDVKKLVDHLKNYDLVIGSSMLKALVLLIGQLEG